MTSCLINFIIIDYHWKLGLIGKCFTILMAITYIMLIILYNVVVFSPH